MAAPAIGGMVLFGILAAVIGLLFGLAAWAFAGGALLMVGGRFIVKTPKATYWRSVGTTVLAGLASLAVVTLVVAVAAGLLNLHAGGPGDLLVVVASCVVGPAAGLLVTWLIIKAMFAVSFGKAILAWLPTLALAVVALPFIGFMAAMIVPALQQARQQASQTQCMVNLRSVGTSMDLYKLTMTGNRSYPADLVAMVDKGMISPKTLICPCLRHGNRPAGRKCDYFYLPPSPGGNQTIVACDFDGNHSDGSRNVLFTDGHIQRMSAAAFQAELAKPENAAFAAALLQAEAPAGIAPSGGD